jgi:Fe-S cluster assembly scaffold protein SufB
MLTSAPFTIPSQLRKLSSQGGWFVRISVINGLHSRARSLNLQNYRGQHAATIRRRNDARITGAAQSQRAATSARSLYGQSAGISANPLVKLTHGQLKVTHEAAIDSADHQALKTRKAPGLDQNVAVNLLVSGIFQRSFNQTFLLRMSWIH